MTVCTVSHPILFYVLLETNGSKSANSNIVQIMPKKTHHRLKTLKFYWEILKSRKKKKKLERKKNIEDMLGMVAHLRKIRVQSPINFPHSVVDSIV